MARSGATPGADTLNGDAGNDQLFGDTDNDILRGTGNDRLEGTLGMNQVFDGGIGAYACNGVSTATLSGGSVANPETRSGEGLCASGSAPHERGRRPRRGGDTRDV